ncbi:uncharacterized protein LOC119723438 [Patiria miniata]|uniref:Uncharacterized protein n=1 Tax=Patiria miniata TaxID=46514 RepID=A0A913ZG88_PATMI|nr:uncharacterized protein LOC119723438 [Patiria miniata]
MSGVSVLSTLLLSVLLKLEDREHRIPPSPRIQRESSVPRKKWVETNVLTPRSKRGALEYDSEEMDQDVDLIDWVLVCKDIGTEVLSDGDAIPGCYTTPQRHESTDAIRVPSFISFKSECSVEKAARDAESLEEEGKPQEIILTCQTGSGDTIKPHHSPSVYQESAIRIVSEALLRAIANIFINGVVRRSLRAVDQTRGGATVREENWSMSTNTSNGNDDDDEEVKQESGDHYGAQVTYETPTLVSEDRMQTKPTKASAISAEWLLDVNRRIAANQVTVSLADMIPPSVASSCDVSRCSSVSVLSSGDRTLNVKATPPSQSKLLWKIVQKTRDGGGVLKTLHEKATEKPIDVKDSQETKAKFQEDNLKAEKAILRAKLSVGYKKHREVFPTERDTLFRESETQTEEGHFEQTDDLHTTVDSVPEERGTTDEGMASGAVDEAPQRQTKARSLPPSANPLLIDVVWRHASHPSFTSQEMIDLKASYARGSYGERQRAEGVVKSALHRAVSSLLVHKVISDSMASISSTELSQTDLRCTPSFKTAVANLPGSSLHGFQWFPYQEGDPAGPYKVASPRRSRQGDERTKEDASQPTTVDKQQSSESSDTYVDARDKFGSSDDLLTQDVKGHTTSSDDEFTDAVCEAECPHSIKTKTSDKSIQVSDIESPSQDDDQKTEPVQLELPMESINFIKDQFNDVKALVAKYREMLYEPAAVDEVEMRESAAQPDTKLKSKQKTGQTKDKKIAGRQSPEQLDEDMGDQSKKAVLTQNAQYKKKDEMEEPSTSKSSEFGDKQETPKVMKCDENEENEADMSSSPDIVPVESIYEESSSEDLESTPKYKPRVDADKRGAKRKRKDFSPAKDKTMTPRKLRKGTGKLRTPAGRSRKVMGIREKTTPDGFLPSKSGKRKSNNSPRYPKKQYKTPLKSSKSGKHTAKSPRKESTSSPKTEEDSSPESAPKVKNRISFFEKISRHRMSSSSRSTDSSPKPNTPAKQAVSYLEKLEKVSARSAKQKPRVQKHKDDKDTDGKRHIDFKHLRDKLHGSKKDEREQRDGAVVGGKKSSESGVDYSPGKGIWTNAAFFEALGKLDEPKTEAERLPIKARRVREEGLLGENVAGGNDAPTTKDKRLGMDRAAKAGNKVVAESSVPASPGKKRLRNKNTNNQALIDQLVSPDDSCISSSLASDAKMDERENEDLLPSCPETNGSEEPYLTALEENCDEVVLAPSKSIESEDQQMNLGLSNSEGQAEGLLAIKEKKKEIKLPQKSSSERFYSLKAETTDDLYLSTETANGPFHSSCDSMHPIPKITSNPSRKASEEVENAAADKHLAREGEQLQDKTDLEQYSSPGMVDDVDKPSEDRTEKLETIIGEAGVDLNSLLDPHLDMNDIKVIRKLSDESQDKDRLTSSLKDEDIPPEEMQVEGDQSCPLSSSKDLDDIDSLNNVLTPLSTSSPRPRRSFMSSGGTCSINGDQELTGITDSPLVPKMDEVLRSLRNNASFLRACNPEDYLDPDAEEHFVTCDDTDDDELPDHLEDGAKALSKDADILTDISQKSSYYTDAISEEYIAGVQDADFPGKEPSSEGKRHKKKWWRFKFFRKRKGKSKETRASTVKKAGERTETPGSLPDEKQQHPSPATSKDAVAVTTVAEAIDQPQTPASVNLSPMPKQKRKFLFGSLRKSKKHRASKNS